MCRRPRGAAVWILERAIAEARKEMSSYVYGKIQRAPDIKEKKVEASEAACKYWRWDHAARLSSPFR